MRSSTYEADDYFSVDRRLIYITLALSLSVHVVVYFYFPAIQDAPNPESNRLTHVTRFRLTPTQPSTANEAPPEQLKEVQAEPKRLSAPEPKTQDSQQDIGPKTPTLDLSRGVFLKAIRGSESATESDAGMSDNHAVVMDSELLRTLNKATRRTGLIAEPTGGTMDTTFSGGTWNEFVRVGGSCFRVQQANPLDSTSREMWYQVDCPE